MDAAKTTASLATPVSMQFITTAVHIPSIIYQRVYKPERRWSGPEGYSVAIVNALKKDYTGALRLRMVRVAFAFGAGSLLNSDLRLALAARIGAVSEM